MILLEHVQKTYHIGDLAIPALRDIDLRIERGEFVAIRGASGSGKTTLLNLVGCLDAIEQGSYRLADTQVDQAGDDQLAAIRNKHIGFVFQLFNLIPRINAVRNVELPMIYAGIPPEERRRRALKALQRVELEDRGLHNPRQLSGGQQQRVAIARALVNDPPLLVADEPTGSLDSKTGQEIMKVFENLNQSGVTIVMVTHEAEVAAYAQRTVWLRDGAIVSDRGDQ
ncbi:MAG: ABC transporter ATP-binding protein [Candidatus Thiodiazotropha sp. (ex Dulcina madagascariensis)]|nr:ABC transporter ATP-binding protein [Candidatus Thiodiazotropha sp. (ex Dulcina madagascariensis)]MCU7928233.1 ABC transporter ATP-binding protein [Candidatus Thiodiazotropha sp. (ex Dulcina madagascariensis)]